MQSYPHEFLAHHLPLMFVAGLGSPPSSLSSSSSKANASSSDPAKSPTAGSTVTSPTLESVPAIITTSDSGDSVAGPSRVALEERTGEDAFDGLKDSLKGLFGKKSGKGRMWVGQADRGGFRVVLVEKNVRLPPRKIIPSNLTPIAASQATPRSPLSPLTPTSPLHPDGLIAPIWLRKHIDLVPSVFVLFLRLPEFPSIPPSSFSSPVPSAPNSPSASQEMTRGSVGSTALEPSEIPLPASSIASAEKRKKELEKAADEELVKEIQERRKRLVERGVKLTVVLMASREMLDDPALDVRLSFIRRQSGLDSRASLFVLTPVAEEELAEFVVSLQEALQDSASEYYSLHLKRIRRKRQRLPTNPLANPYPPSTPPSGRPLGSQGWAVRYEFKAGLFAELRGEDEVARKCLEDCWNDIVQMFASTTVLPPRTKRWAEAKVVADCVAVKICRLNLYLGNGAGALKMFHQHLSKFGDLSRGWGIGEETFEFWSWIARQYRIFAELLELAIAGGLRIPFHLPTFLPMSPPLGSVDQPEREEVVSSNNPLVSLQHPGYYYYAAGNCTVQRKNQFEMAVAAEERALASEGNYVNTSPGFHNEKKVDHSGLIIELFTKAYSLFKGQRVQQTRMSLFVAYRIAETYSQSGQFEMAMKFFERISKTYKREKWSPIVWSMRKLWYECAQQTGSVDSAVRLLLEMMAPGGAAVQEESSYQEDLMLLMKTTTPSTTEPMEIDVPVDSALFDISSGFWHDTRVVGEFATFQLMIEALPSAQFEELQFDELVIHISDDRSPVCVKHEDIEAKGPFSVLNSTDEKANKACLSWKLGKTRAFVGRITTEEAGELAISQVTLTLKRGAWNVNLNFEPQFVETVALGSDKAGGFFESTVFQPSPKRITLEATSALRPYISERNKITLQIKNDDFRDVDVSLMVEVASAPGLDNELTVGNVTSSNIIESVALGKLLKGTVTTHEVYLASPVIGPRDVTLSLFAMQHVAKETELSSVLQSRTIVNLNLEAPLRIINTVEHSVRKTAPAPLIQAETFEVDYFEKLAEAVIDTLIEVTGPRPIRIHDIAVVPQHDGPSRMSYSTINQNLESFPQTWNTQDSFSIMSLFDLTLPDDEYVMKKQAEGCGVLDITWSSEGSDGPINHYLVDLPVLQIPGPIDYISAILMAPPSATQLEPLVLSLRLMNLHPTIPASALSIQVSPDENFTWAGSRSIKIPLLLPGQQWSIDLAVVPIAGTGWTALPAVRVYDGPAEAQREVMVVNGRSEGLRGDNESDGIVVYVRPA